MLVNWHYIARLKPLEGLLVCLFLILVFVSLITDHALFLVIGLALLLILTAVQLIREKAFLSPAIEISADA